LYGLTSEYKYAYSSYYGDSGTCTWDSVKPTVEVELDGYVKLPANDYNSLLNAIATVGPIVVSVDAS
jgi:cathepsin L